MGRLRFVNYSLRPNKNIERKLMVEVLRALEPEFPVREYRYIGMGSIWFVDFKLIHHVLGIHDMVSIENVLADRAEFNRPFQCVKVIRGEVGEILSELKLEEKPAIVWLDHEAGVEGTGLSDIASVCERVPAASIVILTLNADARRLRQQDQDGKPLARATVLRQFVGDAMPADVTDRNLDGASYPGVLGRIITIRIGHALRSAGRTEKFFQLFNYRYSDGAPMVTVGGMILTEDDPRRERIEKRLKALPGFVPGDAPQLELRVPLLTTKEKIALDRLLPMRSEWTPEFVAKHYEIEFDAKELADYGRYYRYYPVFAEYLP